MICPQCRKEIAEASNFCYLCGARQMPGGDPQRRATDRKLRRSRTRASIAGVCAGIAEYLELDVSLVRLIAVILAIFPGAIVGGVIVYLLAWMVIPEAEAGAVAPATAASDGKTLRRSPSDRKLGGVCGGFADFFGVDSTVIRLVWLLTVLLAGTGLLAYIVCWIVIPLRELAPAAQTAARA